MNLGVHLCIYLTVHNIVLDDTRGHCQECYITMKIVKQKSPDCQNQLNIQSWLLKENDFWQVL